MSSIWIIGRECFNATVELAPFHFWKPIEQSEVKNYSFDVFTRDFGKGLLKYVWCIAEHQATNNFYVYAKEIIQPEEVKALISFCACEFHKLFWWQRLFTKICPCHVGCLDSDSPSQYIINESRENKIQYELLQTK